MKTSIQRAWPSPPEIKKIIVEPSIEEPPKIEEKQVKVSIDSQEIAEKVTPFLTSLLNDKHSVIILILCGTSVFCALISLCMAISLSRTIQKIQQRL